MSLAELFTDIYRRNAWRGQESRSGPGSGASETVAIRHSLPRLVRELGCRSVLDAPFGDMFWMAGIAGQLPQYVGIDIIEPLIAQNRLRYPHLDFHVGDVTRDRLPDADLIVCRDCLNHFAFDEVWATLRNFARTSARYVLLTSFTAPRANRQIENGGWRPLNFQLAPFDLPGPLLSVSEDCRIGNGEFRDKAFGVWPMADVRGAVARRLPC